MSEKFNAFGPDEDEGEDQQDAPPVERPVFLETLPDRPDQSDVVAALKTWAATLKDLDPLRREAAKSEVIGLLASKKVKRASRLVDIAAGDGGKVEEADTSFLQDVKPWGDVVKGSELLDLVHAAIKDYVVMPDAGLIATTLWCVFAHAHDAFQISPLLAAVSPEKRCGKTTLMDAVSMLTPRALLLSNTTTAALFRIVEEHRPTMLLDEFETYSKGNEELRGVVNSGHRRRSALLPRVEGDGHEVKFFSTWAPKMLAQIGTLQGTIEDRAVVIRMKRKAPGEKAREFRADHAAREMEPICRRAARWAADHMERLRAADPEVPAGITSDRAKDNWRPLLAIAELAGPSWAEKARGAAATLCSVEADSESLGVVLLEDIRDLFTDRSLNRIESKTLAEALADREDRPWSEWRGPKGFTSTALAKLLKRYRVRPRKIRFAAGTFQGYELEWFRDAFSRYLSDPLPQPEHRNIVGNHSGNGKNKPEHSPQDVPVTNRELFNDINRCSGVPVTEGVEGDDARFAALEAEEGAI